MFHVILEECAYGSLDSVSTRLLGFRYPWGPYVILVQYVYFGQCLHQTTGVQIYMGALCYLGRMRLLWTVSPPDY